MGYPSQQTENTRSAFCRGLATADLLFRQRSIGVSLIYVDSSRRRGIQQPERQKETECLWHCVVSCCTHSWVWKMTLVSHAWHVCVPWKTDERPRDKKVAPCIGKTRLKQRSCLWHLGCLNETMSLCSYTRRQALQQASLLLVSGRSKTVGHVQSFSHESCFAIVEETNRCPMKTKDRIHQDILQNISSLQSAVRFFIWHKTGLCVQKSGMQCTNQKRTSEVAGVADIKLLRSDGYDIIDPAKNTQEHLFTDFICHSCLFHIDEGESVLSSHAHDVPGVCLQMRQPVLLHVEFEFFHCVLLILVVRVVIHNKHQDLNWNSGLRINWFWNIFEVLAKWLQTLLQQNPWDLKTFVFQNAEPVWTKPICPVGGKVVTRNITSSIRGVEVKHFELSRDGHVSAWFHPRIFQTLKPQKAKRSSVCSKQKWNGKDPFNIDMWWWLAEYWLQHQLTAVIKAFPFDNSCRSSVPYSGKVYTRVKAAIQQRSAANAIPQIFWRNTRIFFDI